MKKGRKGGKGKGKKREGEGKEKGGKGRGGEGRGRRGWPLLTAIPESAPVYYTSTMVDRLWLMAMAFI